MKILKILIVLILILFPFGELLRWDFGNNIVLKPLDLVVGLTAGWWVIWRVADSGWQIVKNINLYFVLFPLVGLLSLLINLSWLRTDQFFVSFLYLARWVSYAALLPAVLSFDEAFKKKLVFLLFGDGLLFLGLGFFQYFFFDNLKPYFHLGWDEHMHRMFSTFLDPNFAGAFFVLFFLFVASLFVERPQNKAFLLSILCLTLIAIFLTFSRSALIMLLVGTMTFLVLINKKKLIFFLLAAVVGFVLIASPKFYDENMNLFRETSSKARLYNYATAVRIIQDRPIFGVGFNTYRYTKESYGITPAITNFPSHADAGVDNSFLFVLATTGIVGLLAYAWLWFTILRKAFALRKKKPNMTAILVISSCLALFVNAFFINSLFFPGLMLWTWVIIGLMGGQKIIWKDLNRH